MGNVFDHSWSIVWISQWLFTIFFLPTLPCCITSSKVDVSIIMKYTYNKNKWENEAIYESNKLLEFYCQNFLFPYFVEIFCLPQAFITLWCTICIREPECETKQILFLPWGQPTNSQNVSFLKTNIMFIPL